MKKIYVGNLTPQTSEDDLRTAFLPFGQVETVSIIRDRESGKSWGYGFVSMSTEQAAAAAIAGLNGTELDGRALKVEEGRRRVAPQAPAAPPRPYHGGDRARRW